MNKIIQAITDTVRVSLGQPAPIERFLAENCHFKPVAVKTGHNIALASVPQWQSFGQYGTKRDLARTGRSALVGWHREGGKYIRFRGTCPSLSNLVKRVVVERWTCDLQDVHGFSASKSHLAAFASTDDMVEANSSEMIDDISASGLARNLAHREIRVTDTNPGSDWLQVHQWDGRMFVVNGGGSHHLAAAKYIAARIEQPVPLSAPLHYYSFDPAAVAALQAEFDVYITNNAADVADAFCDAMAACGATWFGHELPEPYWGEKAVFLPRADPMSMRVSQAFKEAGLEELGAHMADVATRDVPDVIGKYLPAKELAVDADGDGDADHEANRRYA